MQFGALFLADIQLQNLLNTVLADDTRHTDSDILHAILAFEGSGARNHLLLVLDNSLGNRSSSCARSHPCGSTQQTGQRSTAYHRALNDILQFLFAQELAYVDTFVGSVAGKRNHRGVAVTADNETVHIVRIALQSLAEEVFQTSAIQCTTHTDDAVARQLECVKRQISHRIHRVRNDYQNSVRAVFEHLVAHTLHDTGIHTDQLLTRHTRLTRQTGSDDDYIRTAGLAVIVRHTGYYGVEAHQLSRLHDIHRFALCKTLLDINQTYFVGYLIYRQHICARSTYVSCANNCNFAHNSYVFL